MAKLRLAAAQLEAGDRLLGSGGVVTRRPSAGLRTPRGKVELGVSYNGKPAVLAVWNARTEIGVERDEPATDRPREPAS